MSIRKITAPSSRSFSDWFVIGGRDFDYCCDCGLSHENRYRVAVDEKKKMVTIYMKSRRAVGRTHKQRKKRKLYKRQ